MACMGQIGLAHIAEMTYHKAHYAASLIEKIPGYSIPIQGTFFQEFLVCCPLNPKDINTYLLDKGIIGGLDVSDHIENGLLVAVTEMNTREEIELLTSVMSEIR